MPGERVRVEATAFLRAARVTLLAHSHALRCETLDAVLAEAGILPFFSAAATSAGPRSRYGCAAAAGAQPALSYARGLSATATFTIARHFGFTLPCPASPLVGCRGAGAPFAGRLRMDAAATNPKAKMQWSWQKGAGTSRNDGTRYQGKSD